MRLKILISAFFLLPWISGFSLNTATDANSNREHLLMDFGWRFALGNSADISKDFYHGTSYFTYFAKAGYGDGPAAPGFEDRIWRQVDLPHDWAAELPFAAEASHSHGYKTIGWKYPENSVGWYRKTIYIPESDLGRKISVQFDGVFRNSTVWVNGFYLGQEHSGYAGFEYDISDYLNYGGNNVITVRVDASTEEGWFYEGAGIYRHTWLNKTNKLHVSANGTFVTSVVGANNAELTIRTSVENQDKTSVDFTIEQTLLDSGGREVVSNTFSGFSLQAVAGKTYFSKLRVENPKLWSLEEPYLYKLLTTIKSQGKVADVYETNVGIRTVTFDAEKGFFLNGKSIKLKGSNLHQDHAGVGVAIPDELQEFRIKRLKEMGNNAIRTSHNPPTPELLDICDRLGVLILDENRLMGINKEHFDLLKRLIERDRNHPCVIAWSLGNEEWAIESNILGERITSTMQAYAQTLDSSRRFTVAISGGCGNGSSRSIDIMGFNYLVQCDIDDYHRKFPNQPGIGTEESTTHSSRGIYDDDKANGHMAPSDRTGEGPMIETGWKFYNERPYLSGLFFWTGFDYRGEPTPLKWPAVSSQYGIVDACGFPKDQFYYLKSWWTSEPVLHITPHWNWKGGEGKEISVWAYSNCDEVELFLNRKSLGKKRVLKNSHAEWKVKFKPGTLFAKGYKNGKVIITDQQVTTSEAAIVQVLPSKNELKADGQDLSVITIEVTDLAGNQVPTANNEITFTLSGPGKIIGVGNGDPASHESDKFIEKIEQVKIENLKMKKSEVSDKLPEFDYINENAWETPLKQQEKFNEKDNDSLKMNVIRGTFTLSEFTDLTEITLFPKNLCWNQSVYVNGHMVVQHVESGDPAPKCKLDHTYLKPGKNVFVVTGPALVMQNQWEILNSDPGSIQIVNPAETWKRKLFSGLAQVIVQSSKQAGEITLTATSSGMKSASVIINSFPCILKPEAENVER